MQVPANFDSVGLDGIMSDWLLALREFSVEAIVVLGPDPFAGMQHRLVLALHPPRLLEAARACRRPGFRPAAGGCARTTGDLAADCPVGF